MDKIVENMNNYKGRSELYKTCNDFYVHKYFEKYII